MNPKAKRLIVIIAIGFLISEGEGSSPPSSFAKELGELEAKKKTKKDFRGNKKIALLAFLIAFILKICFRPIKTNL
mgnify:FL=1